MRSIIFIALLPILSISATACGDEIVGDAEPDSSAGSSSAGAGGASGPPSDFDAQVAKGSELYGVYCAQCHGDQGQGTAIAPAVVGPDALPLDPPPERMFRDTQFRTALDVFLFASTSMPGDDPGSLPDEDMVAILAFALFANGVELDTPLDGTVAESLIINP